MRHLLHLNDLSGDALRHLLAGASRLKADHRAGRPLPQPLAGKVIGTIFEKPSLRTRVSFESGVARLGGTSLYMAGQDVGLGWRESLADTARTLNGYLDAVVLRVFKQETLEELARHSAIPVVNGLSDREHPCQALADVLTVCECFGGVAGKTVAFVGDGNNVARSLAVAVGKLGGHFVLSAPSGYGFDAAFVADFERLTGVPMNEEPDPARAVAGADAVYTDVWTSMGQETERDARLAAFAGYQVDEALLSKAPAHARLLHCLPAHRGEEVSAGAIDGPASVVFEQAANRMYAQMAVLVWLLGEAG